VRRSLARAGRGDLVETAELLVTEVVTNALLHAGTPIDVALSIEPGGLRVEIGDGSPHFPSRRSYALTAGTGRGLMVLERMVDDWGVLPNPPGKTVWFHLTSGDHNETDAATMEPANGAVGSSRAEKLAGETVEVQLLNVPLLLHAAWQEHAQALLREHLLATLDADSEVDAIRVHAEANDAIAVLAAHIPRPEIGTELTEVMDLAVEPKVSRPRVDVQLPLRSVSHFSTLDKTLEAAIALADDDTFLTPPTQPEMRSFRAWLCRQVDQQSRGAEPSPWVVETGAPRESHRAPRWDPTLWDPTPVTESLGAMIAADDADRIIAVSRAALDLLGYDERLVGQRVVSIVPERYRQAHIAGFTMHLLVGSSPSVGKTVVVPALRGDGSEVEVSVSVRSREAPQGRKVFIAELREPAPTCQNQ